MITKKFVAIMILILILGGLVAFEQVYVDQSVATMLDEIKVLDNALEEQDLASSSAQAQKIIDMWKEKEAIICLFVDYRDIESIGRQADLVLSHLGNEDFELAKVENNVLQHVVETFGNMVGIDWQNIA